MKKVVALLFMLALGYLLLPDKQVEQVKDYLEESKALGNINQSNTSKQQLIIENNNKVVVKREVKILTLQERDEKIVNIQSALNDLIEQYNENISDREAKKSIQLKMDKLLKAYNELALPVALAKINEE
jgi:predicted DNA-binding protein YlxM (UPF0122 family)